MKKNELWRSKKYTDELWLITYVEDSHVLYKSISLSSSLFIELISETLHLSKEEFLESKMTTRMTLEYGK